MMILQKYGKATPSVAASLIENLPDEGDPERSREERIANDVVLGPHDERRVKLFVSNEQQTAFLLVNSYRLFRVPLSESTT